VARPGAAFGKMIELSGSSKVDPNPLVNKAITASPARPRVA